MTCVEARASSLARFVNTCLLLHAEPHVVYNGIHLLTPLKSINPYCDVGLYCMIDPFPHLASTASPDLLLPLGSLHDRVHHHNYSTATSFL